MEFTNPAKASVKIKYFGSDEILTSPLGLDGLYSPNLEGDLRRGYWSDHQTFVLQIYDVDEHTLELSFEGDKVVINVPAEQVKVEGQVEPGE